jgi:ubiquinone biosynthesis monooxygenase Coq7
MRHYSAIDHVLMGVSRSLAAVLGDTGQGSRPSPANPYAEARLSDHERRQVAALMRVNHAGEVAAQALYYGQALSARQIEVRQRLEQSAEEEGDHLAWCRERVETLGSHTSLLGPFWYWGSFSIGAIAGAAGDRWSLGFIKETEDQVIEHLQGHLRKMPRQELKSRAVIEQMMIDEARHGDLAMEAGGVSLPMPVKFWMRMTSRVMTTLSYWI